MFIYPIHYITYKETPMKLKYKKNRVTYPKSSPLSLRLIEDTFILEKPNNYLTSIRLFQTISIHNYLCGIILLVSTQSSSLFRKGFLGFTKKFGYESISFKLFEVGIFSKPKTFKNRRLRKHT